MLCVCVCMCACVSVCADPKVVVFVGFESTVLVLLEVYSFGPQVLRRMT